MSKTKAILTNMRVIILIICIILAVVAINPALDTHGVAIRSVLPNSSAELAGITTQHNAAPRTREVIHKFNGRDIDSLDDWASLTNDLRPFQNITLETSRRIYRITIKPEYLTVILNETEMVNETTEVFDPDTNGTVNQTVLVERQKVRQDVVGVQDMGLSVYDAPTSNIVKGLDLAGGTRVLLQPEREVDAIEMDVILSNIRERLNVFGLSDLTVASSRDLSGNQFVSVEIAGVNKNDIIELLGRQGKFEARVDNQTVFVGGKQDIPYVCFAAECSGLNPYQGCAQGADNQWVCQYYFTITLSNDAAQRQYDAYKDLDVIVEGQQSYLSGKLQLYLDDEFVDDLSVSSVFKERPVSDIQITSPGIGASRAAAEQNGLESMKRLRTIIYTGSLPVKLNIVKTDTISPILGQAFVRNVLLIGVVALILVSLTLFVRYRKLVVSLPMIIISATEALLLLGVASMIGWTLDLAAIAGIIVSIGTGVDDQIVIVDETLRKRSSQAFQWKERLKRAFFIIMAAYSLTVVAMLPLLFAGAGLLKGFAITTIIGVTIGVLITRPAFGAIVQILNDQD
ncbi:MAG: hypothetical protein ABIH41_05240 [Nanoarchaeota archaeon]